MTQSPPPPTPMSLAPVLPDSVKKQDNDAPSPVRSFQPNRDEPDPNWDPLPNQDREKHSGTRGEAKTEAATGDSSGAPEGYSRLQVVLHWLIAALVLMQLTVNEAVRIAFRQRLESDGTDLAAGAVLHIGAGLLILALTLYRTALRLRIGAPAPPKGGPLVFEWMGIIAHWGLYALLLMMTLSGAAAWFFASALAGTLHETLRWALVALILAHILGALVEHYVFGNKVIRRMRL